MFTTGVAIGTVCRCRIQPLVIPMFSFNFEILTLDTFFVILVLCVTRHISADIGVIEPHTSGIM